MVLSPAELLEEALLDHMGGGRVPEKSNETNMDRILLDYLYKKIYTNEVCQMISAHH